ncbi:uracil-DNA glycosylase family protein [Salinisphaera orenii]|uniref:uracil-DNA glycosylase family protein n=1 Tax=Salinisphaera orenii TaxID=856731 RepID=UPI000DBE3B13
MQTSHKRSALDRFYRGQGIHSLQFTCVHKAECSAGGFDFTGPKSAFVPDGYDSLWPRIVFLSADSGSGHQEPKERTPEAVKRQEQNETRPATLPKNLHWYQTHLWAATIYSACTGQDVDINESSSFFAHVNSAKCCQNRSGRSQADAKMFRNCRQYLPSELWILHPHIVVTQGNKAREGFRGCVNVEEQALDGQVSVVDYGHRALWLHTYHPSYYRGYWKRDHARMHELSRLLANNLDRV